MSRFCFVQEADERATGSQKEEERAKKQKEAAQPFDDKEGHYIVRADDVLDDRCA